MDHNMQLTGRWFQHILFCFTTMENSFRGFRSENQTVLIVPLKENIVSQMPLDSCLFGGMVLGSKNLQAQTLAYPVWLSHWQSLENSVWKNHLHLPILNTINTGWYGFPLQYQGGSYCTASRLLPWKIWRCAGICPSKIFPLVLCQWRVRSNFSATLMKTGNIFQLKNVRNCIWPKLSRVYTNLIS